MICQEPITVFISFSLTDREWLNSATPSFVPILADKLRSEGIELWFDVNIDASAGDSFKDQISEVIDRSSICVLLITPDFLMSDFINQFEIPLIRMRQEAGLCKLVPVSIGPLPPRLPSNLEWLSDFPFVQVDAATLGASKDNPTKFLQLQTELYKSITRIAEQIDRSGLDALPTLTIDDQLSILPDAEALKLDTPAPTQSQAQRHVADIPPNPLYTDENVQFTVYRPRAIRPDVWYPLLAFAHLSEKRPGEVDQPDPVAEVQREAERILGSLTREYQNLVQDSAFALPQSGEISFVPEIAGIEFNPASRRFLWEESVHREEFRMRAQPATVGTVARGRMTVYLGSILLAEIALVVKIAANAVPATAEPPVQTAARPYRKIFASYSHKDVDVVREFEQYARVIGDEFVRDWTHLRSGDVWDNRLIGLINEADVFQLFWSTNAMRSEFVRREYEHALTLQREHFVRPTYWEEPLPQDDEQGLPPANLRKLHFQRIGGPAAVKPDDVSLAVDDAQDAQPKPRFYAAAPPPPAATAAAPQGRGSDLPAAASPPRPSPNANIGQPPAAFASYDAYCAGPPPASRGPSLMLRVLILVLIIAIAAIIAVVSSHKHPNASQAPNIQPAPRKSIKPAPGANQP